MKHLSNLICVLLTIWLVALPIRGQEKPDSLGHPFPYDVVTVGGLALVQGVAGQWAMPKLGRITPETAHSGREWIADAAQFAPLALPWVARAAGVHTRSGWGQMAVSQALGFGLMTGALEITKRSVGAPRPNGEDRRSFPSGHTARAFLGATAAAIELADQSPWYAVGGYAFAVGMGVQRVLANRHFPADVVAGAGIGILSAELGYYLGDLIFGSPGKRKLDNDEGFWLSNYFSLSTGLAWPVGRISIGQGRVVRMPTLEAGLRGGWGFAEHWKMALFVALRSMPVQLDMPLGATYVGTQNSLAFLAGPQWQMALSRRISLNAEALAGYYKHLKIKATDDAVKGGEGTFAARLLVGTILRLTQNFHCKASVGYEVSSYKFTVSPSDAYLVEAPAEASGVTSGVVASLSAGISF